MSKGKSKKVKGLFSIRKKGKFESLPLDANRVDFAYKSFNDTLTFRKGTSRDLRKFFVLKGMSLSQVVDFMRTVKDPCENSPLFEALRTGKGYEHNNVHYTYDEAIKNVRLGSMSKALTGKLRKNNDIKKVK